MKEIEYIINYSDVSDGQKERARQELKNLISKSEVVDMVRTILHLLNEQQKPGEGDGDL